MATSPLTASQWEILDSRWLAGEPLYPISKDIGVKFEKAKHCLTLLGHEFQPRLKRLKPGMDPVFTKSWKAKYDRDRIIFFKTQVFAHYGARCSCCFDDNVKFLTLDHINDDGHIDKKTIKGASMWEHCVRNNFPDTLRILCWNCNCGRYYNGGICPHELPVWTGYSGVV